MIYKYQWYFMEDGIPVWGPPPELTAPYNKSPESKKWITPNKPLYYQDSNKNWRVRITSFKQIEKDEAVKYEDLPEKIKNLILPPDPYKDPVILQ